MKRSWFLPAFFLLAAASLSSQETEPPGEIRFEHTEVDLGDVYQQGTYPLAYPFEVVGGPVVVSLLEPSCGCTDVHLEVDGRAWPLGRRIPAGSRGVLRAVFESKAFSALKTSRIEVRGSASNLPLTLHLKAMVHPVFQVDPPQALFGEVLWKDLDGEDPPEIRLRVTGKDPFHVLRWSWKPDGVEIVELPETEPGPGGRGLVRTYVVRLTPEVPVGTLRRAVIGETDLGHRLEFLVHATVLGPVRYLPEQTLYFGAVDQGTTPVRRLRILASDPETPIPRPVVRLAGKEVFEVRLEEEEEGKAYTFHVQLKPGLSLGRQAALLEVRWPEGSGLPDRDIPVVALVRRRR